MSKVSTPPIKVALADDHILLRNALAQLIDSFGNCKTIHQSGTGKELIDYIKAGHLPDVVLLDLNMPDMDGFAATKLIRQRAKQGKRLPIVALTAHDASTYREKCLRAGIGRKGYSTRQ